MQKYNHLDLQNRYQIKALRDAGLTQTNIAQIIGVHKSTVSRELSRNTEVAAAYCPRQAQQYTRHRHVHKPKHRRFCQELKEQALDWLTIEKLSPELISGRWKVQGTDGVSHETLYQWIWEGKRSKDPVTSTLYRHLKHGRRRRKRGNYQDSRGILTGRTGIEQRPEVVELRHRLGDIEIDLMVGKAHKSALVVITDRSTLLTTLQKITSRHAEQTEEAIIESVARIPKAFIKTVTVDNDKAFANHQSLAQKLDAKVYFTRPYTSQDKGTVENRIGVIRRFFPKGTDLRAVSRQRINTVQRYINTRPVRKFEYLSPIQQSLKYRAVALIT
jgi:IS30 family transposase